MVTPYIVEPTDPAKLRSPIESLVSPSSDVEYIFDRLMGGTEAKRAGPGQPRLVGAARYAMSTEPDAMNHIRLVSFFATDALALPLAGCYLKPPVSMPDARVVGYDGTSAVPPDCDKLTRAALLLDGGVRRPVDAVRLCHLYQSGGAGRAA